MAITTYGELQTAIANWLDRDDLTARIPEFIALAEKKMYKKLTDFPRTTFSVTGVTTDYVLPVNQLRITGVFIKDDRPLDFITEAEYHRLRAENSTGSAEPAYVWVATDHPDWAGDFGTLLRFWPVLSGSIDLRVNYIKKPDPLSGSQPSNDVLKVSPEVYLYGALAEAAKYLQQENTTWAADFEHAVAELNRWAQAQTFSGAPRPMRLPVVF